MQKPPLPMPRSPASDAGILQLWPRPRSPWGFTADTALAEEREEAGSWITVLNHCSSASFFTSRFLTWEDGKYLCCYKVLIGDVVLSGQAF